MSEKPTRVRALNLNGAFIGAMLIAKARTATRRMRTVLTAVSDTVECVFLLRADFPQR